MNNKPLVYLATPYTYNHEDESIKNKVQEERFERANKIGAMLTREGHSVFSPISASHPMTKYGLPGNWEFWAKVDEDFISCCHKMYVICCDGWDKSIGVQAEIKIAEKFGIPVVYLDENGNLK